MKKSTLKKFGAGIVFSLVIIIAAHVIKDNLRIIKTECVSNPHSENALFFSIFQGDYVVPGRYPTLLRFDGRGSVTINPGRWQQHGQKRR